MKSIFLVFSLLITVVVFGQKVEDVHESYQAGKVRIGLTPSAVLNVFPGIQANATVFLANNFALEGEAGYLFGRYDQVPFRGHRFRGMAKFYPFSDLETGFGFFTAFGINHRFTSMDRSQSFSGSNGPIDYQETISLTGAVAMCGTTLNPAEHFVVDFGIGAGLGYRTTRYRGLAEEFHSAADLDNFLTNTGEGRYGWPLVILHCKLQYEF